MNEPLKLRAHASPWHNGIELVVMSGNSHGVNIVMEQHEPGAYYGPTMTVDN